MQAVANIPAEKSRQLASTRACRAGESVLSNLQPLADSAPKFPSGSRCRTRAAFSNFAGVLSAWRAGHSAAVETLLRLGAAVNNRGEKPAD